VTPRLRRSVDVRLAADGTVYILRNPRLGDLILEGDGPGLARLLSAVDGRRSVEELAAHAGVEPAEVRAVLDELRACGVVDDTEEERAALDARDVARYERQLACFADLVGSMRGASAAQARLRSATVCVIGLGGIGSWVALPLVEAGLGTLVGVDGDAVEESNLNRQALYGEADLGRRKAEAAGERLRALEGRLRYVGIDRRIGSIADAREVMRGADLVVNTADEPPHLIERWVHDAAFELGIPLLGVSQHPPHVRVGPLYVPGETGCHHCQVAAWARDWPLFETVRASRQLSTPSATFGPACAIVGALAANEVVAHLTGIHPPATIGCGIEIDLATFTVERHVVPRRDDCERCGRGAALAGAA
jgi:bacteriocin biosynthesis cyclodehydratase domain-containing protein